jgi:hypothetical protein
MQAIKLFWLYRDYHGFEWAPIITKKAGKCPGRSYGESVCKRCQQRRQRLSAMVEYLPMLLPVLHAASIPEDLTDNELMRC